MTPKYYKLYAGLRSPFYPRLEYQDRLKFNCQEDAKSWAEKRARHLFDMAAGMSDGPYLYDDICADSGADDPNEMYERYIQYTIEYRVEEDGA